MFVKAASKASSDDDGPEVRSLRWEVAINPHVAAYAPRLLWTVEAAGWLALGFEYVEGRHADYTPGSPDLHLLAKVIDTFQTMPCPGVLAGRHVERRWAAMTHDVTPMSGDTMLHTDLNQANLLVTADGRAYVVDWAFASRGTAWVELALLVPWLLQDGHSPAQAEEWLARFPSWEQAGPATLDLFARVFAAKWRLNSARNPEQWALEHAARTEQWARYRADK